jgi:hypothetical protein
MQDQAAALASLEDKGVATCAEECEPSGQNGHSSLVLYEQAAPINGQPKSKDNRPHTERSADQVAHH